MVVQVTDLTKTVKNELLAELTDAVKNELEKEKQDAKENSAEETALSFVVGAHGVRQNLQRPLLFTAVVGLCRTIAVN